MRIYAPTRTGGNPTDRNAANVGSTTEALGVAPHGNTNRLSYTCPAARRATILVSNINILRATAAAPVGTVRAITQLTQVNAGLTWPNTVKTQQNTVGNVTNQNIALTISMFPTEALILQTADPSTGGTNDFLVSLGILEYDA